MSAPNVYQHHDVRQALLEQVNFARTSRALSLREIARRLKVSSGLLTLILKNRRGLTSDKLESLLKVFDWLNDSEKSFLRKLRVISESSDFNERRDSYKEATRFLKHRAAVPKNFEVYKYLSNWFYMALRELAAVKGFSDNVEWLQKAFLKPLGQRQLREAFEFLVEHEFLIKDEHGRWAFKGDKLVECEGGVYRLALGRFHKDMLNMAAESIDTVPREERDLQSLTMAISPESFVKVQEIMRKALYEVRELVANDPNRNRVYHIATVAIPLTVKDLPVKTPKSKSKVKK
jgi:uncharacterized protein (TIGR02147 family)